MNSTNHELRMTTLHTWLERLEEKAKEDKRRLTSKWGWKLKVIHCEVSSATEEKSRIRLGVLHGAE